MKIPADLLQDLSTSIFTDNFQDHVIKLQWFIKTGQSVVTLYKS